MSIFNFNSISIKCQPNTISYLRPFCNIGFFIIEIITAILLLTTLLLSFGYWVNSYWRAFNSSIKRYEAHLLAISILNGPTKKIKADKFTVIKSIKSDPIEANFYWVTSKVSWKDGDCKKSLSITTGSVDGK